MKLNSLLKFLLLSFMCLSTSCQSKQTKEFALPYEKYVLDNGLEVVLHIDKSDPIVAVAIQHHVGSNREKPGKTGFAHFFEHMLFQRSENLPRNAFYSKIDDLGGTFNGGTWSDGTIYYEQVPNDALEKVLWMESDRMGFFINTVSQQGLEREVDVVINEKRQTVDNKPYGHTHGVIKKALYDKEHPYSWTVIGETEDLRSATIDDVKNFYNDFYAPNNATLVIAGNFETNQAKEWINKYFSEIKAREEQAKPSVDIPVLNESVRIMHEDRFANMPELTLTFPTVEMYNRDAYALDILTDLLAGGKKTPLYKEIVEEKAVAPSVNMYVSPSEISGEIRLSVRAFPDKSLDDVYAAIEKGFKDFEANGIDPQDLQRIKNMQETRFYKGIASIMDKAMQMAISNVFGGSPVKFMDEVKILNSITEEDVMRVYEKYIKGQNFVATSFVPMGQSALALSNSVIADVKEESVENQEMTAESGAIVDEPYEFSPSTFDRSKEPPLGELSEITKPVIWKSSAANGIEMYGIEQGEVPLVYFELTIPVGVVADPKGKEGLANVTAQLLREGTQQKTPEDFEDALKNIGAQLNISTTNTTTRIEGNSLAKNLPALIELVTEMITSPRWDEKQFDRIVKQNIARIEQDKTQPNFIAQRAFLRLQLGDNTFANSSRGNENSLKEITIDDVKSFYSTHVSPSKSKLTIVGDVDKVKAEDAFASLINDWKQKETPTVALPIFSNQTNGNKLFFVDYPGAKQSMILIGKKAMNRKAESYYPATIANYKLGDGSGSELFRILRLERGYTYGAYSFFNCNRLLGFYLAMANVQTTVTKESIDIFKDVISNYGDNINQEDLALTTSALLRKQCSANETQTSLLNLLYNIVVEELPENYVQQEQDILRTITVEDVKKVVAEELNFDDMIVVVVGDASTQFDTIKQCGLGDPLLVNMNGEPVK